MSETVKSYLDTIHVHRPQPRSLDSSFLRTGSFQIYSRLRVSTTPRPTYFQCAEAMMYFVVFAIKCVLFPEIQAVQERI